MNLDANDPRLTAYALGELEDTERAEMERLLAGDESARRLVEEIRRTGELLARELGAEHCPHLSDAQRRAIERQADGGGVVSLAERRRGRCWSTAGLGRSVAGLAASLFVVATVFGVALLNFQAARGPRVVDRLSEMSSERVDHTAPPHGMERDEVAMIWEDQLAQPGEGAEGSVGSDEVSGEKAPVDGSVCYEWNQPVDSFSTTGGTASKERYYYDPALGTRSSGDIVSGDGGGGGHDWPADAKPKVQSGPPAREITLRGHRVANSPADAADNDGDGLCDSDLVELSMTETRDEGVRPKGDGNGRIVSINGDWEFDGPRTETLVPGTTPLGDEEGGLREAYDRIVDNPFKRVADDPLSTFSIDVDTAAYANVRRFLRSGTRPPRDAARIEELINYFTYDYPQPAGEHPFSVNVDVASCPWTPDHRLVRIGLQGREMAGGRPACNLVFLLDVSGSMNEPNKLPLVKEALSMLANQLTGSDRVAMVVYAGASGLVLPTTPGDDKQAILTALENLQAGGSTNGGEGIELAYKTAAESFLEGQANRVILCTDGDFNVGVTDRGALVRLIEEKAKTGVFLSVLGFGMGNLQDATLEQLADKGNGNYAYIDTSAEAKKVLVDQLGGTLVTIAKDVKIQVEFNPLAVEAFRLIGYENRVLQHQDFNDDTKDAGEIGAGHTVTALYEIVPSGTGADLPGVDPLLYQKPRELTDAANSGELMNVSLRYKLPDADTSTLLIEPVVDGGAGIGEAADDFRFAAAVAGFGMILRDSEHKGAATLDSVRELAAGGLGTDPHGYRTEFLELVELAKAVVPQATGE